MIGWQAREKTRYDSAYATGEYIPRVGNVFYQNFFKKFNLNKITTVLDVGCGLGWGVRDLRAMGKKAYGIDISDGPIPIWKEWGINKYCKVASADLIPFEDNRFDLVICTDVLEHIPCEAVPGVLREMLRVGNHDFIFNACCTPALFKMPDDGSEPHICVQEPDWWIKQVENAKYTINSGVIKSGTYKGSTVAMRNVIIVAMKEGMSDMLLEPKWE